MYLRDLGDSLLRRWYLVVCALALTAGVCFAALGAVSPTYQTTSSLVLVPPKTTTGVSGNPYLFLGGLEQSVDVLARAVSADATREQIAKTATTGEYEVGADLTTSAPILVLTTTDSTSAGAQKMLDAVVAEVPVVFERLQASLGVQKSSQITTLEVPTDDGPKAINKTRYRMAALASVIWLFLAFMLIGFLDGVLLTRAMRRSAEDLLKKEAAHAPPSHPQDTSSDESRSAERATRSSTGKS
ncbi:hypothetical protein [Aeromicrobium wangtongii]|uniref:hypothetical protein n=1 Tax=Aeromicrobium wangtongii TaxID=2969247 RepID=UPI002017BCBE|nr:hypothetical protein [Aeromicrobium wangtongii]MCL3817849.1 hypothetical protein [Aeromicrobium wangtongii]